MIRLTGKQKRYLRGIGNTLPVSVQIGRQGLDEACHNAGKIAFSKEQLVKFRIHKMCDQDRKEIAQELAEKLEALVILVSGFSFLLYKENSELDSDFWEEEDLDGR